MLFAHRQDGQAGAAIVVVFTIPGCGACEEYLPVFRRVANRYPHIKSYVIDASTQQGTPYADHFGIEATPTTMVLRNPVGAIKTEGLIHERDVHQLFSIAAAQR